MKKFFEAVDNNKKVNYRFYIEKFKAKGIDICLFFTPTLVSNPFYLLTPNNQEQYQQLKRQLNLHIEKIDRSSSAVHGDSHLISVSYAFLLVKQSISDTIRSIFFDRGKISQTDLPLLRKKVVIIENLENFGNTLSNFKHIPINIDEYSFIFGSGNTINSAQFSDFLSNFEEILCLFDIDEGGFTIFQTLDKRYGNCQFIYPNNLLHLMDRYVNRRQEKEFILKMNTKFGENPKLRPILEVLNKTQKTVEQELYLIEESNSEQLTENN